MDIANFHMHHKPVLDGIDVEVDEPAQRVLVHGVYVGQVSDTEEQDGGVLGNGPVAFSRLCYFDLCLLSYLGGMETMGSYITIHK